MGHYQVAIWPLIGGNCWGAAFLWQLDHNLGKDLLHGSHERPGGGQWGHTIIIRGSTVKKKITIKTINENVVKMYSMNINHKCRFSCTSSHFFTAPNTALLLTPRGRGVYRLQLYLTWLWHEERTTAFHYHFPKFIKVVTTSFF